MPVVRSDTPIYAGITRRPRAVADLFAATTVERELVRLIVIQAVRSVAAWPCGISILGVELELHFVLIVAGNGPGHAVGK